jgi:hypothetical protein
MGRIVLFAALAFMLAAPSARAEEPDKFVITIAKVELKNADGGWITVLEPDKEVDLMNAEPTLSFFNNQGKVPAGKYVNFRITLSETIRFAGSEKGHFTREGGRAVLTGAAEKSSELPGEFTAFAESAPTIQAAAPAGTVALQLNLARGDRDDVMTMYGKRDFMAPFEIRKGSFVKLWFSLDLDRCVHYAWAGAFGEGVPAGDVMYVLPPKEITEFTVAVDEREETLGPGAVVLEF